MRQCPRCSGFVPAAVNACPNCAFKPSRLRRGARLLGFIAAGSTLLSACACYGVPPRCSGTRLADGGTVFASATGVPLCTDCLTETVPDGGLIASDPAFFSECHPGETPPDGGSDGGP